MTVFLILLGKLLPLYAVIVLGYISGRVLKVHKESIAILLLYVLSPIIVFHGAFTTELNFGIAILPVFFLLSAYLFSGLAYALGGKVWSDSTRNIFAYTAGTGNTGYFGIPVAMALLGPEVLGPVVLATMGLVLYESTLGFYITAKGTYSPRESLRKLLRLPSLYALIAGLLMNAGTVQLPESYFSLADNFRGAYSILGMMIIGLGVSGFKTLAWDWSFLGLSFLTKFILWPLYSLLFTSLDAQSWHLLTPTMHSIVILLSLTPMAANTVVLATALNVKPEKAALGVLLTTLFALFYIPLALSFLA
ncbi:hypothetical protein EXS65_01395 [Candidatus Peribacteria bacterium]|nr:hypothetical protein [Candidatus Peribacteria bacterium]